MDDATQALRSAIDRLREAEAVLPEDLAAELREVVAGAERALEAISARTGSAASEEGPSSPN